MKIKDALVISIKKEISVVVTHDRKEYVLDVVMTEGNILGNCENNIRTNQLTYFDIPQSERARHFNQIKKYLENRIS